MRDVIAPDASGQTRIDPLVAVLVGAAVVALAARFVGLGISPPGFYRDEAIAAAQLVCLRDTGADASGASWPLISSAPIGLARAFWSPLWLYPALAWVRLFGDSIAALRGFETLLSVIGVVATAGVARNFLGSRAFGWALLMGAVSPWSWTIGRVGFGNSAITGVAFLMAGMWLVTRGAFRRSPTALEAFGGAVLILSAALPYQTRIVAFAMAALVLVVLVRRKLLDRRAALGGIAGSVVALIPVLVDGGGADLWGRASEVSLLADPSLPASGPARVIGALVAFASNLLEYLSPRFLVVSGDTNPRHSAQIVGHLGWLELALILATPVAVYLVRRRIVAFTLPRPYLAIVVSGMVVGLSLASLSEGGHGLRSYPALPFLILGLSAVAVVVSTRWRLLPVAAVCLSLLFSSYFVPRYFEDFPRYAAFGFDAGAVSAAAEASEDGDWERFETTVGRGYDRPALIYFETVGGKASCPGPA